MATKDQNPWGIPEFIKVKHKLYGWVGIYEYDVCYQDWFLWTGTSLAVLDDWKLEDFDIL